MYLNIDGKTVEARPDERLLDLIRRLMQPGDILLHGHTHIPAWDAFGEKNLYLNPGSVSIPKAGSCHSYMILNEKTAQWKSLDGGIYHEEVL